MQKILFTCLLLAGFALHALSQTSACTDPVFRELDFWIGNWNAYATNGNLAGTSKISLILDSCVVLEEWTSASTTNAFNYKGKSFNTYNTATGHWQQTWVDNTGNTTEYLHGENKPGQIIFQADNILAPKGKTFQRRLTFTKINDTKVRQFGERSDDGGNTWTVEYDLEYRKI